MSMHNGRNRIADRRRAQPERGASGPGAPAQKAHDPSGQPPAISATETKRKKRRKSARDKGQIPGLTIPLAQMPPGFTVSGTPCFPAGLVAPKQLGVVITSVAMPDIKRNKQATKRAVTVAPAPRRTTAPIAAPIASIASMPPFAPAMAAKPPAAPVPPGRPALTLPKQAEPLVVAGQPVEPETAPVTPRATTAYPDDRSPFFMPEIALPRNRALTQPSPGLVGAIGAWLHSFGRLIASGFLVKKTRARPFAGPTPANRRKTSRHATAQPTLREAAEVTQLRAENRRLRSQLDALDALRNGTPAPQDAPSRVPSEAAPVT